MSRQIVILAGGKGTRMGSPVPKVLIPLHNKPVIEHLLQEVKKVPEIGQPIIVVGYEHKLVEQALGPNYSYALQEPQLGTGHAVQVAQPFVTADHILVLYGDIPLIKATSMINLLERHESSGSVITMFTTIVPDFEDVYEPFRAFGRIVREPLHHTITKITEYKDATEQERSIREVNIGIYSFNTAWLWPSLKRIGHNNAQGEYYLTDLIELAIRDGHTIESLSIEPSEAIGINTPEHLDHAHKILKP
jgi:bifunctional UDP-N-acetylglucosamine pyrophosphorylase / glucosamine-1-phosphate N-acetyltransferase